jgi:sulfofructose kinase
MKALLCVGTGPIAPGLVEKPRTPNVAKQTLLTGFLFGEQHLGRAMFESKRSQPKEGEVAQFDVLCVGAINFDLIAQVDRIPTDDERMFADAMVRAAGGPAATAAVTLAKLGHRVALSSAVGRDPEGDFVLDSLQAAGVDTRWVSRHSTMTTSQSIILANRTSGHRTIVTQQPNGLPDQFPEDAAPIVHVDQVGYGVVAPRLRADRRDGPALSIDGGNPIPGLDLQRAWLYAPTVAALAARYGTASLPVAAQAALTEGAELVVATAGSRGSWWFSGAAEPVHVPAAKVEVTSTLGAGDVFHGALLAALLDRREPADALLYANVCAGLSCSAIDGQSGIPNPDALQHHIDTTAQPQKETS